MKIAIEGAGYIDLSNATLFPQHNEMVALDIIFEKVELYLSDVKRKVYTRDMGGNK